MANASVQGMGRDCLVWWRLLAVGAVEWGEEFGAKWWFMRVLTVRRS